MKRYEVIAEIQTSPGKFTLVKVGEYKRLPEAERAAESAMDLNLISTVWVYDSIWDVNLVTLSVEPLD